MSDLIKINGLELFVWVGVTDEERSRPQKLLVSIDLKTASFDHPAQEDDIRFTVDYVRVMETVRAVAQEKPRRLIETLAVDIAEAILRQGSVKEVAVEVEKFIVPQVRSVAVRIKRKARKPKNKSAVIASPTSASPGVAEKPGFPPA